MVIFSYNALSLALKMSFIGVKLLKYLFLRAHLQKIINSSEIFTFECTSGSPYFDSILDIIKLLNKT